MKSKLSRHETERIEDVSTVLADLHESMSKLHIIRMIRAGKQLGTLQHRISTFEPG